MLNDERGETLETTCCIAGGGPAGMMLGYLLARAGVDVAVLEKHKDFLRDFRGDTIHPSTLEVMHQLGLLDELLQIPHDEATQITGVVGDNDVTVADFTHLPTHCGFVAFMPQWDFLNFLARKAQAFPTFHLLIEAEATDLIEEDGHVAGLRVKTPAGPLDVRSALVVGADGRGSVVRERSGLKVDDIGAPIDVLWFRIARQEGDANQPLGRFNRGKILVMLFRGDFWQCAYVIPKGGLDQIRERGLPAFRSDIAEIGKLPAARVAEITDWDQIKLLTVRVDRLEKWWRPGLICIGDSAHAMSPIGGVGINLAIQDAVAAANLLTRPLRDGTLTDDDLERVQHRREFPTRATQQFQVFIQERVIRRTIGGGADQASLPLPLRLLERFPRLRELTARLLGLGVRPEKVEPIDTLLVPEETFPAAAGRT
jgi:2-polyprenyl-6-methoxyphenol hydroxylase-like FAD-dependent oxidoreductase